MTKHFEDLLWGIGLVFFSTSILLYRMKVEKKDLANKVGYFNKEQTTNKMFILGLGGILIGLIIIFCSIFNCNGN